MPKTPLKSPLSNGGRELRGSLLILFRRLILAVGVEPVSPMVN